jgi:hypothetical protein
MNISSYIVADEDEIMDVRDPPPWVEVSEDGLNVSGLEWRGARVIRRITASRESAPSGER